jgi:sec-independent protein translocase protein TatC
MGIISNIFRNKKTNAGGDEMSFLDHIDALRGHLFRSAGYITVAAIFVFTQKTFVIDTIILGPIHPDFVTYRFFCGLSELTCISPSNIKLFTRELSEQLTVHLKVSFFLGIILAFPLVFREFWLFVKPGLYDKEVKATSGVIFWCTILFVLGVLFGYYVLAPFSIAFLASYNVSDLVESTASLSSYVDSMTMYTMATGIVFELPLVVYFLARLGIMGPAFMRTYRRHAVVVISIIAAIITPPDVTSMLVVTIPILILYEISIYIAALHYPKETISSS